MPPTMITTRVWISTFSPMPDWTEKIGPAISPARPANAAPRPKIAMFSRRMLTPRAETISGCVAPARISMPIRVRLISQYKNAATPRPTAMIANR